MNTDKLNSLQVEKEIIGGMMAFDREFSQSIRDLVKKDWFSGYATKIIFQVMLEMMDAGLELEHVNIAEELNNKGMLEKVGGHTFLSEVRNMPCIDVKYHASLLSEYYQKREIFKAAADLQKAAFDEQCIGECVEEYLNRIRLIREESIINVISAETYRDSALGAVSYMDTHDHSIRIITGIEELDEMTGGFRAGELVVLTAETGTGKTLLAAQLARESCKLGAHGLFVSGEMLAEHIALREMATKTGIPLNRLRRPETLNAYDRAQLLDSIDEFCRTCRIFDSRLTIESIATAASYMHRAGNLKWMVLDYDELIEGEGESEIERQAYVAGQAKAMAIRYGCVVVLVSQLRKTQGAEARGKPDLNRLFGSGAKGKHASTIISVDREFVRELKGDETKATICVLKNRDGRGVGKLDAIFDVRFLRFTSKPKCSN